MRLIYTLLFIIISGLNVSVFADDLSSRDLKIQADSLYLQHKYTKALDMYIKALKTAEKENDMSVYMGCVGYIANINTYFGDSYSAIFYLNKGYELAVKENNQSMQSCFLSNCVPQYCKVGDLEKARHYQNLLKKTPLPGREDYWRYFVFYNDARIQSYEKNYEKALKLHNKALLFAKEKKLGSEKEMFQENEIALMYLNLKDYSNSIKWADMCAERALKENYSELLANAYQVMSESYKALGDSVKGNNYYNLYKNVEDSIYNVDEFYMSKHELMKYQDSQNKSSYDALKTKAYLFVAILLIITVIIIVVYNKKNKKANHVTKKSSSSEQIVIEEKQIEAIFNKISEVMADKERVFNPDFSLNMLADEIHSNTKYVSWVINNKYQKNFKALLNERRIEEACRMLDDEEICKNYTIQSIYEEIGYKNATSFIRAFKKLKGVTPVEYRNRNKDNGEQPA